MTDDLIAQKRVMSELNISRAGLWRARNSGIKTFPAPTIVRTRVYWRRTDLPALRAALTQFRGRAVFEQSRRHAKAIAARAEVAGLRTRVRKLKSPLAHPDLFAESEALAPSQEDSGRKSAGDRSN